MATDPFGGDVKPIKGVKGLLRCRVGDYRISFTVNFQKSEVVVLKVGRREAILDEWARQMRYYGPFLFWSLAVVQYRRKIPLFTEERHLDLDEILARVQGKWLTYNDHPRIRELYKGFKISEVATRLNTDKMATANRRLQRQLIIRNY